jgi:GT2 family glycosyltransferase/glycosyltransferase involved in cell wall biosynthesis
LGRSETFKSSGGLSITLTAISCSADGVDVQGTIRSHSDGQLPLNVTLAIGPVSHHRIVQIEDGSFRARFAVHPGPSGRVSVFAGNHQERQSSITVSYECWRAIPLWRRVLGFYWFYLTQILPLSAKFLRAQTRHEARQTITKLVALDQFRSSTKTVDVKHAFRATAPEGRGVIPEFTIVVPVFNGFAHVARLLDCLRATNPLPARIIIIDDCSTDDATHRLLAEAEYWPELNGCLKLIRNPVNLGFVKSANIGLAAARGHVILLNSDVVLPPDWVGRLLWPIIADQRVASVTPFSNAATLCSFPVINTDNKSLAGLALDRIDAHFAVLNPATFDKIDLPSGIGFCFAMNCKFIDLVGYFDERTFGLGYVEENDWCQRAVAAGGRNALAGNLYVLHDNGGSFAPERKAVLKARNLPRLKREHGSYSTLIAEFLSLDPTSTLRTVLLFRILAHEYGEDFEIIVDHGLGGGSNAYREKRIVDRERTALVSAVATWRQEEGAICISFNFEKTTYRFSILDWTHFDALVPAGRRVTWLLNGAVGNPKLANCLGYLAERADKWHNRLVICLHDYYPVCPSLNLLNRNGTYCGLPDSQQCAMCLPGNRYGDFSAAINNRKQWTALWAQFLTKTNEILAFSEASATIFQRAYPQFSSKLTIRPHGKPLPSNTLPPVPCRMIAGESARIAVVGAIGYSKGAAVVAAAAREIESRRLPAELVVIGKLDSMYVHPLIEIHGPYVPEELPGILRTQRIHVAWIPSICPETYCYVADELMVTGMPLVCFDIGAPPERIRNYCRGLVLPDMDPATAISRLIDHARSFAENAASQAASNFWI